MTDTYVVGSSGKAVILKDPEAILDYIWDWTAWLDDIVDTLAFETVTVPTGLVLESEAIVGKTVVAFISGGTVGQTYPVTCHITTAGGNPPREDDRTIFLKISER
jgi:hypothetical protein